MKLLLLFIVLPAVELALLIRLGGQIGTLSTLALIIVTGTVGASLARRQGLDVMQRAQADAAAGRMPAGSMIDGVIILVAGALLITPGILTDVVGFSFLVPGFRNLIKAFAVKRFETMVKEGQANVQFGGMGPGMGGPGVGGMGGMGFGPPPPGFGPGFGAPPAGGPKYGPGAGDGPIIDVTPSNED